MREMTGTQGPSEAARTERQRASAAKRARREAARRRADAGSSPEQEPAAVPDGALGSDASPSDGGSGSGLSTALIGGLTLVGGGVAAALAGGGGGSGGQTPPPPTDTTPPTAPTLVLAADTGSSATDGVTRDGTVNVGGLEAGARWEYSVNGGASWTAGSGTSFVLPSGAYPAGAVRVRQADAANNVSPAASIAGALVIDAGNPGAPAIGAITGDNVVGESERAAGVTVAGTAEPGSRVTVAWGATTKDVVTNGDGTWSASFASAEIPAGLGASSITARATDAAGNASPVTTQAVALVPTVALSGQVVAGPILAGSGLTVDLYRGDGTLLKSGVAIGANGGFATQVDLATGDLVIARVLDASDGPDFLDEATGATKDLDAQLLAVGIAQGGAITLNVNPLTTIAARKAGLAGDGSGTVTEAAVTSAYLAVAKAFGLSGIDLARTPAIPSNGGGYDPGNGISSGEKIGAVLAALSGADLTTASMQATINAFVAALTVTGSDGLLSATGMAALMAGANAAELAVPGALQTEISNLLAAGSNTSKLTIASVATDNVVNAAEAAVLELKGAVGANPTGVTLMIGGQMVTATLNGRNWSYALTDEDRAALAADGAVVVQAKASFADGSIANASRAFVFDRTPPAAPTLATVGTADMIGAAQKTAGVALAGTAEPGSTVQIDWAGATKTATAAADGSWSTTFASAQVPTDGSRTVSIVAVDPNGNAGPTTARAILVDTKAPAAPVIGKIAANDIVGTVEAQSDVTVTGTAEANATVRVTWGGVTKTTTASAGGAWSAAFAASEIPADGATTVSARQTDPAGNTGVDAARAVLVARAPAAIVLTSAPGDEVITRAEAIAGTLVAGIAPAGSTVELAWGDIKRSTTVDANGDWSFTLGIAELPGEGTATLTVTATGATGSALGSATRTVFIDTIAPDPVTLAPIAANDVVNAAEKTASVTLSGTAEPNAPVEITWGGTTKSVTAGAEGGWSVNFTAAELPADGATSVSVRQFDGVGNPSAAVTRAVRVDSAIPAAPSIALQSDTGALGGDALTNIGAVVASGIEADATWEYSLDGGEEWLPGDGASFVLPEGEYSPGTVRIRQTDAAGNVSAVATNAARIEIDQTPPEPSMDEIAGDGVVNAAERAAGVTIFGLSEAGATVTVSWNGLSKTTTAGADGGWSVAYAPSQVPADGASTLVATSTDRAGNAAVVVASAAVSIDTGAPPAPTATLVADTGVSAGDRVTNDGRITIGGIEAGAGWEYSLDGGASWVEGGGAQLDLADGSYKASDVLIRQVDAAGNASTVIDLGNPLVIDSAIGEPVIAEVAGDGIVNGAEKAAGVTISGTAEANASVDVTWGSTTKTVSVDGSGAWSAVFSAAEIPAAGPGDVTARASDLAGNISATVARSVTVEAGPVGSAFHALFAATESSGSYPSYAVPIFSQENQNFIYDARLHQVVI